MLQHEILKGAFVAELNKQEQRIGGFLGIDVLQNIGVRYLPQQVDFLQKSIGGDHRGVGGDFLHGEHGADITLASFVVSEVNLGHGSLAQHVGIVDLVLTHNQVLPLAVHPPTSDK